MEKIKTKNKFTLLELILIIWAFYLYLNNIVLYFFFSVLMQSIYSFYNSFQKSNRKK